jgi:AraC family transcriptional activator of pobA
MSKNKLPVFTIKNFTAPRYTEPDFYIKTFQQHKTEHPFVMKPHSHDFYLLMIVTKGGGTHTIELNNYDVKPGSVFFMSPSEAHSWKLNNDTDGYILFFNTQFYLMDFKAKNLFDLPFYNPSEKTRSGILTLKQLSEFKIIMDNILCENAIHSVYQKSILRSYLDIILLKLAVGLSYTDKKQKSPATALVIPKLEALIEQNFIQHQPVLFYAKQLNLSAPQLNSITKNYLNKTVVEMLQARMIAEAKRLLVYSSFTISEIAYQLNFNDNSYFNRFFKKVESVTPEQFRKRIINAMNS